MNIRIVAASAVVFAALSGVASASPGDFINKGTGLSDREESYYAGKNPSAVMQDFDVTGKGLVAPGLDRRIGDYIDETPEQSNQRSGNR